MHSSRGSSQPRDPAHVSDVLAGGFFASSATWEAQLLLVVLSKSLLFENRKAHTLQLTKYLTRAKECIDYWRSYLFCI